MKHFKYRVVVAQNWHISDEAFQRKGAIDIYFSSNDFREAEAKAKELANETGLDMELYYRPAMQNLFYVYTVRPFMKGRLIK